MNFFQRIFGRTLSPAWTATPGAVIWKLQPTPGGVLVGESRDPERKQLSLFALRPADGTILFSDVRLQEPWWIALEMTIGEVAILHTFPRPDLPNALGATALDAVTGGVLWSDAGLRVLCGTEELALVQRGNALDWRGLALLDARTGRVLEEIGESPERVAAFQKACEAGAEWEGWIVPEELAPESPEAIRLAALPLPGGEERRGPMERAEYGPYTVAGYHTRSRGSAEAMLAGSVDAHLLVLRDDRPVYHEIVTRSAPGPSSDIFFIWHGMLIFIRDRRTLVGINLNQP